MGDRQLLLFKLGLSVLDGMAVLTLNILKCTLVSVKLPTGSKKLYVLALVNFARRGARQARLRYPMQASKMPSSRF
jgi:hypothetical protein